MTTYFFATDCSVEHSSSLPGRARCGALHDLPGHPVPRHACLGGTLVAAHLQAYDVLSLAKLLL